MRVKKALTAVGVVLAVGAVAVTCASGEEEKSTYVGAAEVCDGVFAGPLEQTVESVTGATSFYRLSNEGVGLVSENLKEGHASGRSWTGGRKLCEMVVKDDYGRDDATIDFSIYAPQDVGDVKPREGVRYFSLGKESFATSLGARMYFECVSPQMKGSDERPARINAGFTHAKDRGDALENLQANMTVVNAAALAVAEKLDCENNGGLREKPDLQPLP
ncbi:hypothetical protein ACFXP3_21495 [Streptomyces sp. NPDC059096]|uniref:hypothetical protein n=1 Tax=Streptomyces sp. NPDC059096 TaxID=3346727 RepID=UPI0036CAB5BB